MTDYSTSRYQDAVAERAHAVALDGFAESTIYSGDLVAFDLVTTDEDGAVILRYDSDGFVWVETDQRSADAAGTADMHGHFGRKRVLCHFDYLAREYREDDEDVCEGYSIGETWLDCSRPMPHVHGILADIEDDSEYPSGTACGTCGRTDHPAGDPDDYCSNI